MRLSDRIFVIDANRCSSAGGSASADMMLHMIAGDHGPELAAQVADQMIYTTVRTDATSSACRSRPGSACAIRELASVIRLMEQQIEEPEQPGRSGAPRSACRRASSSGSSGATSTDRRSATTWSCACSGRGSLLLQTDMSVINVALACGFTSPSHFSKCYRAYFRTTPYRERGTAGEAPQDAIG
ncbi:MAG: hypothetical protein KatS3mg118_0139 [Paracoccaceae bacterium]|nr:MAG: hypothetical protein KatS3mg118_0139 [Paracoccaceae bacterium]